LIGQLKGGLASCTNVSGWDEYGRISESWNGGGSSDTRLRDHLSDDPNVMQSNTISIPSLTIPDVICGNTNMTIANLPMNNLTLTGGGIQGAQLTNWFQNIEPIPGYNGPGFLELQLRPSGVTCNDPLIIRKDFWVGPPPVPDASIIENDDCRGFLSVANPEPNTSYSWKVTRGPNWYTYYLAGPTVFLHNWGPNYSWIAYELTASNSCGSFVVNGGGTLIGCGNPVSPAPDNLRGDSKANKWSAQLSPNPASNELNINLKEFSENKLYSMVDVKIVNMTGQIVLQTKKMLDRNMLIDIHSLTNGLYFIDIQGEGVSMRHKFSVSK
jgi:hypothetical protein